MKSLTRFNLLQKGMKYFCTTMLFDPVLLGAVVLSQLPFVCSATTAQPVLISGVYTNQDLILVNPLQSTSIFLGVIFFSTGFELACERMDNHVNKYTKIFFYSIKEEMAVLGFAQLVLLFVLYAAVSFTSVKLSWLIVIEFTQLCLVYMAFAFVVMATFIGVSLQLYSRSGERLSGRGSTPTRTTRTTSASSNSAGGTSSI